MEIWNEHGGARNGAGRKPVAPKTVMKSVKLTPDLWERAQRIGEGNAAEGIRRALKRWKSNGKPKPICEQNR
jgi:hypothetical protein